MKINFKIVILSICFVSLQSNSYSMHNALQQRINNLHNSLTELATKLKQLTTGLKTIKNRLAGIKEPAGEVIEQARLHELIETIQKVAFIAPNNEMSEDTCIAANETLNGSHHEAREKIITIKDNAIDDALRAEIVEALSAIRQEIKIKYQEKLNIGNANNDTGAGQFSETINQIKGGTADYNNVLNDFLQKDTTSLRNPSGYNAIQVVVNFMDTTLENETVNANQVLNDALSSMQFRTQTLILFYILLKNNFFNDTGFLNIVAQSVLGYVGQSGFDHLGKCVTAQLLEKIPNMNSHLLDYVAQNVMNYNKNITQLSNKNPNPQIGEKIFNQFKYYQMTFSALGIETKSDILRFILALQAEIAILELHEHKPIAEEEPIVEPIAVQPEPEVNKLIKKVSDEIKIAPAHVSGAAGFPVAKFKSLVKAMLVDTKQNLLKIKEAQGIDILGYFKLFTQKGHQYFMNNPQLKATYQQMLSLCSIIMESIFNSQTTIDELMIKYQNLTLLAAFTNFLFNVPQADFAAIDDPAFDPADCLRNINNLLVFKPGLKKYEHANQNMLQRLIEWFQDAQRDAVQDFFTNTNMPQMGKTVVFQSAFKQLEEALKA